MMTDQQDNQTAALVEAGRWLLAQGTEFKFGVVALRPCPPLTALKLPLPDAQMSASHR